MQLIFTPELLEFLNFAKQDSIIAQILLEGKSNHIKDFANYIARSNGEISYIPISKIDKVDDVWKNCRVPIKLGRFIKKIFTDFAIINFDIKDQEIERFVNLFRSYFTQDESKLLIVSGEEIKKYYLHSNYHRSNGLCLGSLWNSCMRQAERNKYLTLYTDNPEQCKMLVYLDDEGKVRARALLWDNVKSHDSEETIKFMDRIYTVYDHDVEFFFSWAQKNGYITKAYQNAKTEMLYKVDGKVQQLRLFVNLNKGFLSYVPYLDTFKYFNPKLGRYSSSPDFNYSYVLVQSDGSYEREPEPETEEYDDDNGWN